MNNDNLLLIGSAPSTIDFFKTNKQALFFQKKDCKSLAFQAAYPAIENSFNFTPEYWSWGDPTASLDGLSKIKFNLEKGHNIPHIIIPSFLENVDLFEQYCGTSQITSPHATKIRNFYNEFIAELKSKKLLTIIENCFTMRRLKETKLPFPDLKERFSRSFFYFHSVPFTGRGSWDISTFESKLTTLALPLAFYLQSKNVFVLGFDHQGKGLNTTRKELFEEQYREGTRVQSIERMFKILEDWAGPWKEFHHMSIYSIVNSTLTRNNKYINEFIYE